MRHDARKHPHRDGYVVVDAEGYVVAGMGTRLSLTAATMIASRREATDAGLRRAKAATS